MIARSASAPAATYANDRGVVWRIWQRIRRRFAPDWRRIVRSHSGVYPNLLPAGKFHLVKWRPSARRLSACTARSEGAARVGIAQREDVTATGKYRRRRRRTGAEVVQSRHDGANGHAVKTPANGHAIAVEGVGSADLHELERLMEGHWRLMSLCDRVGAIVQDWNCTA